MNNKVSLQRQFTLLPSMALAIATTGLVHANEPAVAPVETVAVVAAATVDANVYLVKATEIATTLSIGGTVVPRYEVKLAAQLPGRVKLISGQEGDQFKAGSVLVALNDELLLAKHEAGIAGLRQAEASFENAKVQYHRERVSPQSERASQMAGMTMPGMMDQLVSRPMADMIGLEDQDVQRQADLHQLAAQVGIAESQVSQAIANLKQIESMLRDSQSIAPFDGVITAKSVHVGDTVQPGFALINFANLSQLQVQVDIPSRLSRGLKVGSQAAVRLEAGAATIPVTVDQVFPMADIKRHTISVKFGLPQGTPVAPGSYVDVLISDPDSKGKSLPSIPRSALLWRGSLPGVMVLDDEDKAHLRLIRITDSEDSDLVQVYAGLSVGDRLQLK